MKAMDASQYHSSSSYTNTKNRALKYDHPVTIRSEDPGKDALSLVTPELHPPSQHCAWGATVRYSHSIEWMLNHAEKCLHLPWLGITILQSQKSSHLDEQCTSYLFCSKKLKKDFFLSIYFVVYAGNMSWHYMCVGQGTTCISPFSLSTMNSGCQAWWRVPLPTEPPSRLLTLPFAVCWSLTGNVQTHHRHSGKLKAWQALRTPSVNPSQRADERTPARCGGSCL